MHTQSPSGIKVFADIKELLTLSGAATKGGRRVNEGDLSPIRDAAMIAQDETLLWVGPEKELKAQLKKMKAKSIETIALKGGTVLPAFIECHTHLVFAGDRSQEFEWRMQGQSYQDIANKGGGILSTVKATREASENDLKELAQARANEYVRQGVTTLEVKSGYGLDIQNELKILKVARSLSGPEIVTTYLGAHARAPEHKNCSETMKQILSEDLNQVAVSGLADRTDIYIEKGFFAPEEGEALFLQAQQLNLPFTAHVEQLSHCGGLSKAMRYKPQSVDHVVFASDEDIAELAKSDTTAVLLPGSDFYLRMQYPRARAMIDQGVRVALATDFNPGTCPTQDLSLVGVLSRLQMNMSLAEVLVAYTLNAAWALGKSAECGSLEPKKRCDFIVLDEPWQKLFYSVGSHPVAEVWGRGERLFAR